MYVFLGVCTFTQNNQVLTFEQITENEKLWAVRYDGCLDNVLDSILEQWNDVVWLRDFFKANLEDLASYFKITDVNQASWLRIYAIKLKPGIYVITGGAIKLTRTMQEREHTLVELARMEKVRRFMLDNDITDKDSFNDYQKEIN